MADVRAEADSLRGFPLRLCRCHRRVCQRTPLPSRLCRGDQGGRRAMSARRPPASAPANARLEDTEAEIETPERMRFRYRVAGPAHRFAAYAIDFLLRGMILVLIAVLFGVAGASSELSKATTGLILI